MTEQLDSSRFRSSTAISESMPRSSRFCRWTGPPRSGGPAAAGHLLPQVTQDERRAFRGWRCLHLLAQVARLWPRAPRAPLAPRSSRGQSLVAREVRPPPSAGPGTRPVGGPDGHLRVAPGKQVAQRTSALVERDELNALGVTPAPVGVGPGCRHADVRPGPPVDAQGRQARARAGGRPAHPGRRWRRSSWPARGIRAARRPTRRARRSRAAAPGSAREGARPRRPWGHDAGRSAPESAAERTPSSRTPAACRTPRSGGSDASICSARPRRPRVATSSRADDDDARPASVQLRDGPRASAVGARRLMSARCRAPCSTSQRATASPRPPSPPVTR